MPLAFVKQLDKTVSYSQSLPRGGTAMTIGDYKRTVESYVGTTYKLGGLLAFGSTLKETIMAAAQPVVTLQAYIGMDEAARRPHDLLLTYPIVTIITTKGCNYGSSKKWLAQNQLIPGAQAYTKVSNELVHMINTGTFPLIQASKNRRKVRRKVTRKWLEQSSKYVKNQVQLSHKEGSFFRCAYMYMDRRWNYDHKYFQRMIDRHGSMNAEVVGCIITGMSELNNDDSFIDGGSMPSLQDRGQSDWSSNNDIDSYGDDDMYDDGEL